jgi:hypothetical protein
MQTINDQITITKIKTGIRGAINQKSRIAWGMERKDRKWFFSFNIEPVTLNIEQPTGQGAWS